MGLISPTLPTAGQSRATEEADVTAALTSILGLVNGSIDAANLSASANIPASKLAPGAALELLVGGTRRKVAFGSATATWSASGTADVTVAHGLSGIPLFATAVVFGNSAEGFGLIIRSADATNVVFQFRTDDNVPVSYARQFWWVAFG